MSKVPVPITTSSSNPFGIKELQGFLRNNNILPVATGFVVARNLHDLTDTFFEKLIVPIVQSDNDNNGIDDLETFLNKNKFVVYGRTFYYGKLVYELIKFIVILYTLFIIIHIFKFVINY
jgi:large-conductance mechanosensitive channel